MHKFLPLILLLFALAGCQVAEPLKPIPYQPKPTPMQLRAHAAAQLAQVLRQHGVQVVHVGESVRLVISSNQLFLKRSSNFNTAYLPTLNVVADMLKVLESTSVKITGYTDNRGSRVHNSLVSVRQAQKVLNVLWSQGIDVRLMVAYGNGDSNPIATNRTTKGQAENRRIEIVFHYVPLLTSLWSQEA